MADPVKSRSRIPDFVPVEHVLVHALYFNDPKQHVEMRYSASLDGETLKFIESFAIKPQDHTWSTLKMGAHPLYLRTM